MKKSFNEDIAKFFESPSRDGLRSVLQNHFGEQNFLDFKESWPDFSKVAKHVLAMANSGGGIIVFGVSEKDGSLEAAGLEVALDKANIVKGIKDYFTPELDYTILDFFYAASEFSLLQGKKFQVLIVDYKETHIPFISRKSGSGIKGNAIYVRRGTSSEEILYEELQKLINTRIGTKISFNSEMNLEDHLAQLKLLYSHIKKYHIIYSDSPFTNLGQRIYEAVHGEAEEVLNAAYPIESYDSFIARIIENKKKRIERLIET
ncbi:AlbA family DNA-binding domain-containing protein [Cohnella abietis]|uniref:Schlafen AlbA-2 domain-containing protein n=1 Tax=Cohnella abietis TaxID=2507935 RepID=A0A3T1D7L6_9BACL|nr:ATP-binding protein [Cohnella abietis]BBI34076.1 hypothetical protein KCTCHS21_34750 [Cohnella abietis]